MSRGSSGRLAPPYTIKPLPTSHVIFVNRVYWPAQAATAQLLTDLAEGLAARGWAVHVIAAGREPGRRNGVTIHRTGEGETHGGLVSRTLNYRRFSRRACELLVALAQPGDVVVTLTDPPMLGAALTKTALARGARLVHWVQDIYPEIASAHLGSITALLLRPLRAQRDAAWRAASICVTLGWAMAQHIASRGVPVKQITVIPNWAPQELQAPPDEAAVTARRAIWGLSDKFIVAYSGNLGRVHAFKTILAAADRLKERAGIIFLFIGLGARIGEVRAEAKERQLPNLRFLPPEPRENLAAALAAADAHLVTLKPAFADLVYPSKLAGVLAAGRPVLFVGPPAGEIALLLTAEGCGQATAPDDGKQLAETIIQWASSPGRRTELGLRARGAFERHFAFSQALDRWENILQQS